MSTLKGTDGCTDIILDFIAGGVPDNPSGESGGNYNAVIGDAHASDDLGAMTLNDIYALMDERLADGMPSTAMGRYQIISRTMQALAGYFGLTLEEKFTPALQDKLAVRLLVGRGYPGWWRGGITDREFANHISMEWASLPDPARNGRSHYDGVGQNHASTSLDHVYAMLKRARAAKPG